MEFDKYKLTGQRVSLKDFPTRVDHELDDKALRKKYRQVTKQLRELQRELYAESKQSVLMVLQAMDAAGKDSSIAKLTGRLNTQGSRVSSFKKPTDLEQSHDFLWRIHHKAPAAGEITFFNRSHYEDVLVVKVHGWASEQQIQQRYKNINEFESLLNDRGTRIIKCMLNISPEYQLERFTSRLANPGKYWKFNPGDLDERQRWHEYMAAFEMAMSKCASDRSPWYMVPAENRKYRDLMLATILRDTLLEMGAKYPEPDFDLNAYNVNNIAELSKIK